MCRRARDSSGRRSEAKNVVLADAGVPSDNVVMHTLITSAALVALFFHNPDAVQKKAPVVPKLSESEKAVLFRVCESVEAGELERCKARQLRKHVASASRKNAEGAYDAYEAMDLGQGRLRSRLKENRLKTSKERAASMKSFGEDPTQQTSGLQPRPYVDLIRTQRLECMLKPPGRQRSLCLDELGNKARALMQEARPSMNSDSNYLKRND